jgi:excisionase family DNA binding protein
MGYLKPRSTVLRQALEKHAPAHKPALLTMAEACAHLRISKWTLYRLMRANKLKTIKIGSRRLVEALELQRFIDQSQDGVYSL